MNVLVVVAHPDDEILGCGATIKLLADQGHNVYLCVLCAPADARHNRPELDRLNKTAAAAARIVGVADIMRFEFPNIRFNVVPHIEMVQSIEQAIVKYRPSWIFTHHPGDLNIDHRICYETTMAAALLPQRRSDDLPVTLIRKIFLSEVLSSTDWAPSSFAPFQPNSFFDVTRTLDDKVHALETFEGALKPFPHSRSRENVIHLARLRGAQMGIEAAEAFCLVRDLNVDEQ